MDPASECGMATNCQRAGNVPNLRRLSPQLSKLVAQLVHKKYQPIMKKETAELRAVVLELLNRGHQRTLNAS